MNEKQILRDFYIAYLDWVEKGAVEDDPFIRELGLCGNLVSFLLSLEYYVDVLEVKLFQVNLFTSKGLEKVFPFNGRFTNYRDESERVSCHLNKDRIQLVKDTIIELEE